MVNRQLATAAAAVLTDRLTRPAPHREPPSSVSAYARGRSDRRDAVHCTQVAGSSHATALSAERSPNNPHHRAAIS